jgi:hypothetical protein
MAFIFPRRQDYTNILKYAAERIVKVLPEVRKCLLVKLSAYYVFIEMDSLRV